MNYCRVHPSRNWVESQIPEIVKNVVKCLKGDDNDTDELDAEAFVQAYVNIIIGACISLGKMSFLWICYDQQYPTLFTCMYSCLNLTKTWGLFGIPISLSTF